MSLKFTKYQGIGNDFLVVFAEHPEALTPADAVRLCDRHYGVGGDGVLIVSPGQDGARARMTVLNADGSRPEMCGNGLRCVALAIVHDSDPRAAGFVVETDAGPRTTSVVVDTENPDVGMVRTGMGQGRLADSFEIDFEGEKYLFCMVSMGNPHAICFRDAISDEKLDRLGPLVSGRFPAGTNVEIVTQRGPLALDVHVWERGVGRTLACGTGAVGSVVVAADQGLVPFDEEVTVQLPGGKVMVRVDRDFITELTGPAARVFSGTTELAELQRAPAQ